MVPWQMISFVVSHFMNIVHPQSSLLRLIVSGSYPIRALRIIDFRRRRCCESLSIFRLTLISFDFAEVGAKNKIIKELKLSQFFFFCQILIRSLADDLLFLWSSSDNKRQVESSKRRAKQTN